MKTKAFITSLALLASFGLHGNASATTKLTVDDLVVSGSASDLGSNGIQLTAATAWQSGSAFNTTPVDITHFHASFTYEYIGSTKSGSADGLVFVVKSASSTGSGATGGGMGYYAGSEQNVAYTGISNSVGVEFDNWGNGSTYDDPDSGGNNGLNHIGIDVNGNPNTLQDVYATLPASPAEINGSGTWYGWVDYNGTTMTVTTSQNADKSGATVLAYGTSEKPFLITDYVGSSTGLVGFTAATGTAAQTHVVKSFNYSPNPEPSTYVLMGIGALIAGLVGRRRRVLSAEC